MVVLILKDGLSTVQNSLLMILWAMENKPWWYVCQVLHCQAYVHNLSDSLLYIIHYVYVPSEHRELSKCTIMQMYWIFRVGGSPDKILEFVLKGGYSFQRQAKLCHEKGYHLWPACGIPVSAWPVSIVLPYEKTTAPAYLSLSMPAWNLTLRSCIGFGELQLFFMSISKASPCTWWRWSSGYCKCLLI